MVENNAVSVKDAYGTFSCVRIKPLTTISARSRVENPYEETQVFVEVQFRTNHDHLYLTRNNRLLEVVGSREKSKARELHQPTTVKLFHINFVDLLASDIFRNCNVEPLLSMDILDNSHSKVRFWTFFRRVVSRYGNKVAKRNIKRKKSVLNIVVRVENVIVGHHYWDKKHEEELEIYYLDCCWLKSRSNANREETRVHSTSIFQTVGTKKLNEDMVNDDGDEVVCVICLDEFKKANSILKFPCEHLFHSDCIIKWINKTQPDTYCPICMDELTLDLMF
ncbi:hypothetical protein MKW94_001815 [Papaver nudicaule]|uniref:RING-type domain-containing protein n=1 Tax=Papaver nudicaule TaxID=74823 RepID=A0AA41VPY7_PAPNU|nr:hypothetical protein [Papaver nudicaule]